MFSYLRYFFATSIVIILAGAALFGWYYRVTADNIIRKNIEQNNITLAKSFRNTIWEIGSGYADPKDPRHEMTFGQLMTYHSSSAPPEFEQKARDLLKDIEIVQFNIYTPDGNKIFSTNYFRTAKTATDPKFRITDNGKSELNVSNMINSNSNIPQSELLYVQFFTPRATTVKDSTQSTGALVRTLIPMRAENSPDNVILITPGAIPGSDTASNPKPEIILEIYFDVTKSSNKLRDYQWFSTCFIISIFSILYIALIYTSRRAEKIIERQHETNVDLAAAKASAENENQQKSQFLSNISHELRTPLNAIIGFSEIIKDEVMGELANEQYKNYIKDIHSSGVYLLSLINDILDYSKAEAGKLDIEYEDIDLNKLITSSLRLQEPRAKTAEVNLVKELPEEHLVIRSDTKRMRQILLNLLSNAVKFTHAGGTVKISAWRNLQDHDNISIEVKDTGIGIAPKDIAKALAPFGQVDSELSRRYEGTGLGLPLTKKFIELLGGQLKLSSELNKGTTVTVTLPINSDKTALAPRNYTPNNS